MIPLALWFGTLLLIAYAPVLRGLALQWWTDDDMGHGILVPVVAALAAWQTRNVWLNIPARPNLWGLALAISGGLMAVVGTLAAELFLPRLAFVVSLSGMVLYLAGSRIAAALAFPLGILLFMIPIPAILYGAATLPLQLFASQCAETALHLLGVPVLREGNVIELAGTRLQVVEACSGIRSLLSLTFLGAAYAYWFEARTWARAALLLSAVPLAIAANALRVTMAGLAGEWNPEHAQGMFHGAANLVVFVAALGSMIAVHQGLIRLGSGRRHG